MIKEDYCSYEVARLLKEKGFEILTGKVYDNQNKLDYQNVVCWQEKRLPYISAPTHQMAMKWLREVHGIFIQISAVLQDQPFGLHYRPSIQDYHAYARHDNFSEYITYEEAVEAALKYSLENLI